MRENRLYGSEGGEPQTNAVFLPLSFLAFAMQPSDLGDMLVAQFPVLAEYLAEDKGFEQVLETQGKRMFVMRRRAKRRTPNRC